MFREFRSEGDEPQHASTPKGRSLGIWEDPGIAGYRNPAYRKYSDPAEQPPINPAKDAVVNVIIDKAADLELGDTKTGTVLEIIADGAEILTNLDPIQLVWHAGKIIFSDDKPEPSAEAADQPGAAPNAPRHIDHDLIRRAQHDAIQAAQDAARAAQDAAQEATDHARPQAQHETREADQTDQDPPATT
jgi:hypothetical protein